jgi:ankyrin repeat protein
MLACMLGFEDIASMLITAGAEINFQDIDDNTILHQATLKCTFSLFLWDLLN